MSCGVCLVDIVLCGEMGIFGVFSVLQWGFYDILFSYISKDLVIKFEDKWCFSFFQGYGSYVMENVLFKISFFVEFYVQIVVEVVVCLYLLVKDCL